MVTHLQCSSDGNCLRSNSRTSPSFQCTRIRGAKTQLEVDVFGGAGYSQHVLTIENLTFQRKQEIKAKEEASKRELERELENTNINKFLRNFESRVYAELSKQLSEKLFGEGSQKTKEQ